MKSLLHLEEKFATLKVDGIIDEVVNKAVSIIEYSIPNHIDTQHEMIVDLFHKYTTKDYQSIELSRKHMGPEKQTCDDVIMIDHTQSTKKRKITITDAVTSKAPHNEWLEDDNPDKVRM